jgi:glycerol-3-phosphate dehydrogenase subunit B
MHADNFVLATGSFFSKGMIATPEKVYEPVFGLDLVYGAKRADWFDVNFWNRQNYISYGAKVNSTLNPSIDNMTISNLYVIGSLLGGSNALYEGSGGGIAIISAMAAADAILEK